MEKDKETIIVREWRGVKIAIGGEKHAGWLPANAATPLTTTRVELQIDVTISKEGEGYILEYEIKDSSDPDSIVSIPLRGDYWFQTLEEALQQARYSFGLDPSV